MLHVIAAETTRLHLHWLFLHPMQHRGTYATRLPLPMGYGVLDRRQVGHSNFQMDLLEHLIGMGSNSLTFVYPPYHPSQEVRTGRQTDQQGGTIGLFQIFRRFRLLSKKPPNFCAEILSMSFTNLTLVGLMWLQ